MRITLHIVVCWITSNLIDRTEHRVFSVVFMWRVYDDDAGLKLFSVDECAQLVFVSAK